MANCSIEKPTLTNQEIFNISATHLLTQLRKSQEPGDSNCLYRGPEGLMCAAGPFVVDGVPNNCSFTSCIRDYFKYDFTDEQIEFIQELQYVHDRCNVDNWRERLTELAEACGLTMIKYTKQEVFRICYNHLLEQGAVSRNEGGICLYRHPDGLMCAAGPFVVDGVPECNTVRMLDARYFVPEFDMEHILLLRELQLIHDCNEPSEWKVELENLYRIEFEKEYVC